MIYGDASCAALDAPHEPSVVPMRPLKLRTLFVLVALFSCLGSVSAVLSVHGYEPWQAKPARSIDVEHGNVQRPPSVSYGMFSLGLAAVQSNPPPPSQALDGAGAGNPLTIQEYKNYSYWCYLENKYAKKPDAACDKGLVVQNDAKFLQQAERLALAGDVSSQLALGLWWHEKVKQTLADYNISAKNENIVKQFDFDNPDNNTDHTAYLAGATLKKQALEGQRWLASLAANDPQAAEALDSLLFLGLLR
jgi:hypothetical protein